MTPLWSPDVEARIRTEAHSLDRQERPPHVQFCKRCVVSNQRPRIVFDDEGICSACRFAERKANGIDWTAREGELQAVLDAHRRKSGYDVIVPCSGGKDSAYVAHQLKARYGMRPLCVKWAPFLYTDIGRRNFDAFVQSGFDAIVMHPNGILHRKLARLAFEYLGDPFQPFVYGQLAFPMRLAAKFGISLVFYGENGEAEYGGDPAANDRPCWNADDWERVYVKGIGVRRLIDIGTGIGALSEAEAGDLSEFYVLPPRSDLVRYGTEFHWLGYYHRWHPQGNYYYATENTGFESNPERSEGTYSKYASLDDKLDGLHYHMAHVKFGLGRATSDAAHEIRDGDIEREDGVALVRRYDGEFPRKHLPECLEYLGMDEDHLARVIERFRSPAVWDGGLLRHAVA